MPLHIHPSGERVHTVPGSREDARLHADPAWHLDDPHAGDDDAPGDDGSVGGEQSAPLEETP